MTAAPVDMTVQNEAQERRIRAEFPAIGDAVYLNTAAEGLGSVTLERSFARYVAAKQRGSDGRKEFAWTGAATKSRLARWLSCQAEEIGFFGSTSEAINIVLHGLPWQPDDNIVITDLEFPSAMIGCLSLAKQFGLEVRVVPHHNGDIETGAIAEQIDARTRLVILSHVSFYSGVRFDVPAVVAAAHAQGALVLVDASQSLGAFPVAVGDVDFLVACPFKWLLASHGLGILYASSRGQEALTRHIYGWHGAPDFLNVMQNRTFTPHHGTHRFEAGMLTYPAIYALHDALELLDSFDPPWISHRVQHHATTIRATCCELGLQVLTPADPNRRAGIVSFAHPQFQAIGDALAAQGVVSWYGVDRVRFSPHFYVSDADIYALQTILLDVLHGLPSSLDGRVVTTQ